MVSRNRREPFLEAMRQKLRTEEGKQIYKKRGYTVEPAFGEMKWDVRKPAMNLRGPVNVRGEFSLMCPVHNVENRQESARRHSQFVWDSMTS
jgi:transposase